MQVITTALDLAKTVFQVHGIGEDDAVVFNRTLRQAQVLPVFAKPEPCLIGMTSLPERRPVRVATVAMANKTARIVWAVLTRNEPYSPRAAA